MTPNQQLTFNRSTNKVDVKEIDTDTFTAWKDGLLKYKSIPFTELIENLKDIYQVEIRIDDERLADPSITVSGTFNQKTKHRTDPKSNLTQFAYTVDE